MSFTPVVTGNTEAANDVQQIIDALSGTPGKGQPIALTALSDTGNFALSVKNSDATNSRALQVLKSDGTTLLQADVNGITLPKLHGAIQLDSTLQITGNAGIGTAPVNATGLNIYPSSLTGTSQFGVDINPTVSSGATSNAAGMRVQFTAPATAFTIAGGNGIAVSAPTLGAGSAVTTMAGVTVANQGSAQVTTAVGVDVAAQSGATTNMAIRAQGDCMMGKPSGATGDTTGFLYLNSCAGTPTGNPALDGNGWKAIRFDTTANKLWVYNGGWHFVTLT